MATPNIAGDLASVAGTPLQEEPSNAKDLVYLYQQALNAKQAKNYSEWKNNYDLLKIQSQRSLLAAEEKAHRQQVAHEQKMTEMIKITETAEENKALRQQVVQLLSSDSTSDWQKAMRILSVYRDIDASKYQALISQIARQMLPNPKDQELVDIRNAGGGDLEVELRAYEQRINNAVEDYRKKGSVQGQPQAQAAPPTEPIAPLPGAQSPFVGQVQRPPVMDEMLQTQPTVDSYLSTARGQMPTQPPFDIDEFNRFRGIATSTSRATQWEQQYKAIQQAVADGLVSPEEANQWLLDNPKSPTATQAKPTGEYGQYTQWRDEYIRQGLSPKEAHEKAMSHITDPVKGATDTRTANEKDWESIVKARNWQKISDGTAPATPEYLRAHAKVFGYENDPEKLGLVDSVMAEPKLLRRDKNAVLSLIGLTQFKEAGDSIRAYVEQIKRIRSRQGAWLGNMDIYLKDPDAAIEAGIAKAKKEGKLDVFLDTLFPDRDKGLGMILPSRLFPTQFDKAVTNTIRRAINTHGSTVSDTKYAAIDTNAQAFLSLMALTRDAIRRGDIYTAKIPFALRSKFQGIFRLAGLSPITDKEATIHAVAARALAVFMNQISGAAVSEEEVKRLSSTMPTLDDPPDVFLAKIDAGIANTMEGLVTRYAAVTDRETAKQIANAIYDDGYNDSILRNRLGSSVVSQLVDSLIGDDVIENLTYGDIQQMFFERLSRFNDTGKEWTAEKIAEVNEQIIAPALKEIAIDRVRKSGQDPKSLFGIIDPGQILEMLGLRGVLPKFDAPAEIEAVTGIIQDSIKKLKAEGIPYEEFMSRLLDWAEKYSIELPDDTTLQKMWNEGQ